ncbi:MAG: M48 family metalloprotease [Kiritimatiellia bacterium]
MRVLGQKILAFVIGASGLLAGCATNPVTGKSELHLVPESQEIMIGAQNYAPSRQAQGGTYMVRPEVEDYVRKVGKKVAAVSDRPSLPYEFSVLNNSEPNAWALPGGKIAVNRGLLTELNSEAELAAVIGHEIVHAAARHGAKTIERGVLLQAGVLGIGLASQDSDYSDLILTGAQVGAGLMTMKYSRGQESESDHYGMKYMQKAGYDTQAAVELQETFVRLFEKQSPMWIEGLFASHPPSRERVEANRKTLAEFPPGGFRGEKEYRDAMAGLRADAEAYKRMDEGTKALADKNYDLAISKANEALRIQPDEAMFHALAAAAFHEKKQERNALTMVNKAISLNSDYYELYLLRGRIKKALGDPTAAADLKRSNQLLPTATASEMLGRLALDAGDRESARRHFGDAAQSDSEAGRAARAEYARLGLAVNPGEFMTFDARLDRQGRADLLVMNNGPVAVRDLLVQVSSRRDGRTQAFRIPGPLAPGEAASRRTLLGPYADVRAMTGDLLVKVVSAEAAE